MILGGVLDAPYARLRRSPRRSTSLPAPSAEPEAVPCAILDSASVSTDAGLGRRVDLLRHRAVFGRLHRDAAARPANRIASAARRRVSPVSTRPPALFHLANSRAAPAKSRLFTLRSSVEDFRLPTPQL